MNNRHRQVSKLYRIRAQTFAKRLPSAVEMLTISRFNQARIAKLMDLYSQLAEKLENYIKNLSKEL